MCWCRSARWTGRTRLPLGARWPAPMSGTVEVAPRHGARLLPLRRGQYRVDPAPRALDDRVEPGLGRLPHGAHLAELLLHERVDPDPLRVGEPQLARHAVAELALAHLRRPPHRTAGPPARPVGG